MEDLLNLGLIEPINIQELLLNLLLCIVLASFLAWFYARFGRSPSNRQAFARNLPIVALTTVVIIQIVQSSLAISLGLVGALSIVRFRTAIKEPEELAFMFLAITMGLGLGAGQRLATIVSVIIIFLFILVRDQFFSTQVQVNNLFLDLQTSSQTSLAEVEKILGEHVISAEVRRLDSSPQTQQFTFMIRLKDNSSLNTLTLALREQLPTGQFSFIDQVNTFGG